jgi:hypothetical protein
MAPAAGCNGCVEGKSRVCRNTTTGDNVGNREDGGICFDIRLVSNSKSLFYHCTQRRRFLAEGGIVSDSTASAGRCEAYIAPGDVDKTTDPERSASCFAAAFFGGLGAFDSLLLQIFGRPSLHT